MSIGKDGIDKATDETPCSRCAHCAALVCPDCLKNDCLTGTNTCEPGRIRAMEHRIAELEKENATLRARPYINPNPYQTVDMRPTCTTVAQYSSPFNMDDIQRLQQYQQGNRQAQN